MSVNESLTNNIFSSSISDVMQTGQVKRDLDVQSVINKDLWFNCVC